MRIRIHYHRSDRTTPLSMAVAGRLWSFVNFSESDDYGRIATVELTGHHKRVGFVIRPILAEGHEHDRYIEEFTEGEGDLAAGRGSESLQCTPS